jgi:hypothetical protein
VTLRAAELILEGDAVLFDLGKGVAFRTFGLVRPPQNIPTLRGKAIHTLVTPKNDGALPCFVVDYQFRRRRFSESRFPITDKKSCE